MTFVGTLRPYQEEAVARMVDRGQMLLGMVMGAGKTPTTIAAVEKLAHWGEVSRCLVVVPTSLKYQWREELSHFAPDAKVTIVNGTAPQRAKQWRLSIGSRYVIVNPESLIRDEKKIGQFDCIVLDEATCIKTRRVKRSKLLKRIGGRIFYRFALTGQPIENRPEELFSIMEFVDRSVLGDFALFDTTFIERDRYGRPSSYRNLDLMHECMRECMVRKTFEDIKDQLPEVIEQVIAVPFDAKGSRVYRTVVKSLLAKLDTIKGTSFDLWSHYNGGDDGDNAVRGDIMSRLTVLRMLCDNPELVVRSAHRAGDPNDKLGSQYALELTASGALDGVTYSPKLAEVLSYVDDVLTEHPKNKVVLFSFFRDNLTLIQEALDKLGYKSVLFMGGMSSEERDKSKQQFGKDPDTRVFLSSDAGGYGVDLPMANYLISYDLPWSSGKLEQRNARIIRLSSEFPHVTVASFVMEGSIEQRQHEMLQEKKKANEAFIDGKHQDAAGTMQLTLSTLRDFLKNSEV